MLQQKTIAAFHDRASEFKAGQHLREHEFSVYLANAPAGYDGASSVEPLPTLKKIDPGPRVVSKPLDTVVEREGSGAETARLQRYEISEITRTLQESDLQPLYFLLVSPDVIPTPEDVRDRKYVRYLLQGSPNLYQDQFKVMVVEER
jgi:hypothetical protein